MTTQEGGQNREKALERVSRGPDKQAYLCEARSALQVIACTLPDFTTDDIRDLAPVPEGMEPRVLGALMATAARRGMIVKTGERRNTRYAQANARDQTVWRPTSLFRAINT